MAKMQNDMMREEGLSIRRVDPGEADAVNALVADVRVTIQSDDLWTAPDSQEVGELLDRGHADAIGLYDGSDLIGLAFLVRGDTTLHGTDELERCGIPAKGTAEIRHVMLHSDWRKEGLAGEMVSELLRMAEASRGTKRVYALIHHNDMSSQKLFERAMFISCCGAKVPGMGERALYHRWFADRADGADDKGEG